MSNTFRWAEEVQKQFLDKPTGDALQAAGVNYLGRNLYASDADERNAMFKRLQATLPSNTSFFHERGVSRTLALSDPARVEPRFRQQFEKVVCDCAVAAAHDSPTLRPITTFDQTGREMVEFIGRKRGPGGWMEQYTTPPLLMKRMGSAEY